MHANNDMSIFITCISIVYNSATDIIKQLKGACKIIIAKYWEHYIVKYST